MPPTAAMNIARRPRTAFAIYGTRRTVRPVGTAGIDRDLTLSTDSTTASAVNAL